ncbi:dnj-22 [Pristionchus pacificus]|uniref:Dnj-22 n=1 Tax=Pristionchus pacificus TaxID=54126 RepID=A0A2A6C510_PRIPA|nr:dnj-22 [Pristionchus pacificus]|eukprot:PDM73188.1 dnj-22 [Pristionchus pacificus]
MPPSSTMDPYAVLELQRGCSEAEIAKAYKKQCLKWHPDKNRNNEEEASKRFILAKEAFELLFDKTARADYDRKKEGERVRDEKQRARMEKADGDRKRFMEDLERREKEFEEQRKRKSQDGRPKTAADKKREEERAKESFDEIRRRLEREVNEEIKEQQETFRRVRDEHAAAAAAAVKPRPSLRVEWRGGDYDDKQLRNMFRRYGKIAAVTGILLKKNGKGKMCVVEFESGENAWGAELENGREGERFKASWMVEPEKEEETKEVVKEEGTIDGGRGGGESTGPDLNGLSFEELQAMCFADLAPPTKKVKGTMDNPSWKEGI